ncbi:APC family permease [Bifidobacterium samirii]|nr:APC family permease [Bifidobacterium samirii]
MTRMTRAAGADGGGVMANHAAAASMRHAVTDTTSATAATSATSATAATAASRTASRATAHAATVARATTAARATMTAGQLAMLTLVAVASLRSLPAMADYGLASVALYLIPAVLFLIPTALVAAELATGWKGGVYVWVREAFGDRAGFVAIWLQWIQNVVWYPIQLSFIAVSLAYVAGDGRLGRNGVYVAATIIVLYWISTLIALAGGTLFARVGSVSGLVGTLFPALLLIVFGGVWLASGAPSYTPLDARALLPPWTGVASIVLVVSNVLAYAGMEVNAVHANDLREPGRDFPRAIGMAVVLILLVLVLPTLAIAIAVPHARLGLIDGINLAFDGFFSRWGMPWGTPAVSLLIAVGAFASVVAWIAGPSRGLLAAARTGLLPPAMQRRNQAGVQVGILIPQGVIVTVLALLFVIVPNGDTAFATLVDMAAALYLVMYMMMFAAAIRLRRTRPAVVRSYRVPMLPLVAGVGFAASAAAFVLAFVRPAGFSGIGAAGYALLVGAVVVVLGVPPLVLYALRRPDWDLRGDAERRDAGAVLVNPPTAGDRPGVRP